MTGDLSSEQAVTIYSWQFRVVAIAACGRRGPATHSPQGWREMTSQPAVLVSPDSGYGMKNMLTASCAHAAAEPKS